MKTMATELLDTLERDDFGQTSITLRLRYERLSALNSFDSSMSVGVVSDGSLVVAVAA